MDKRLYADISLQKKRGQFFKFDSLKPVRT